MNLNPIEDILKADPGTVDDALRSLRELTESLKNDSASWENPSLERYLEAMTRWLEAMKGRVDDKPCWQLFALMLEAANVYE